MSSEGPPFGGSPLRLANSCAPAHSAKTASFPPRRCGKSKIAQFRAAVKLQEDLGQNRRSIIVNCPTDLMLRDFALVLQRERQRKQDRYGEYSRHCAQRDPDGNLVEIDEQHLHADEA
jgi:hypothetical protein